LERSEVLRAAESGAAGSGNQPHDDEIAEYSDAVRRLRAIAAHWMRLACQDQELLLAIVQDLAQQ